MGINLSGLCGACFQVPEKGDQTAMSAAFPCSLGCSVEAEWCFCFPVIPQPSLVWSLFIKCSFHSYTFHIILLKCIDSWQEKYVKKVLLILSLTNEVQWCAGGLQSNCNEKLITTLLRSLGSQEVTGAAHCPSFSSSCVRCPNSFLIWCFQCGFW